MGRIYACFATSSESRRDGKQGRRNTVKPARADSGRVLSSSTLVFAVCLAAFFTRLLPLSISAYPFNNDSLTECGIATQILGSGHLHFSPDSPWYGTHSTVTPALDTLLAFFSAFLGMTPIECAQVLCASISVSTVGLVFLLGRSVSGSSRGGLAASLASVMLGTFVFTTGSVWKEMLGISLLLLVLLSFISRGQVRFWILGFVTLLITPFVHHLVAAIVLLSLAYMVTWSWFFSIRNHALKRRHLGDLGMVLIPGVLAISYYAFVSLDRISFLSTPLDVVLLISMFALVSLVSFAALSLTKHARWSYAPILGILLLALVFLDYSGSLFPYDPSASSVYFLLAFSYIFLFSLAWYGSELIIETRPMYRSIPVALLVSPLTVIWVGLLDGFSLSSHQVLFRTFDFLDFFVFFGIGAAMVALRERHRRLYSTFGVVVIIGLAASFPFAYYSEQLLGVRHDTQSFEMDALAWVDARGEHEVVLSDQRLAYVALNFFGLAGSASLPQYLSQGISTPADYYCLIEDSWTTLGVNDYPRGKLVLSDSQYLHVLDSGDLLYVGGPFENRVLLFTVSEIGHDLTQG